MIAKIKSIVFMNIHMFCTSISFFLIFTWQQIHRPYNTLPLQITMAHKQAPIDKLIKVFEGYVE